MDPLLLDAWELAQALKVATLMGVGGRRFGTRLREVLASRLA